MSIPYSTIHSLGILIQRQREGPRSRQPAFNLLAETIQCKFFRVLLFHLFLTIATSVFSSFPLTTEYVSLFPSLEWSLHLHEVPNPALLLGDETLNFTIYPLLRDLQSSLPCAHHRFCHLKNM